MQGHSAPPATSTAHQLVAEPRKVRLSFRKRSTDVEKAGQHDWRFATTVRRTRTGCPLDAKRCKWHVVGVRCAAPIGTNKIWRAIWLRWLELGRGRSPGRHFGEVTARPAPQDLGRGVRRLATFGTRALDLARGLSQLPKRATRMVCGMEQWLWAERTISNRRKPRGSGRGVPSRVVAHPYPPKNIPNHVPWRARFVFFALRQEKTGIPALLSREPPPPPPPPGPRGLVLDAKRDDDDFNTNPPTPLLGKRSLFWPQSTPVWFEMARERINLGAAKRNRGVPAPGGGPLLTAAHSHWPARHKRREVI